jgi:hypothetical protein
MPHSAFSNLLKFLLNFSCLFVGSITSLFHALPKARQCLHCAPPWRVPFFFPFQASWLQCNFSFLVSLRKVLIL